MNSIFRKTYVVPALLVISFVSCTKEKEIEQPAFQLDIPAAKNTSQIDPKILLGSKVFNDPNLSVSE